MGVQQQPSQRQVYFIAPRPASELGAEDRAAIESFLASLTGAPTVVNRIHEHLEVERNNTPQGGLALTE